MERLLGKYSDQIYSLTRIVVAMMFWMHGTTKLFGFPPGARGGARGLEMFSMIWTAGVIETIGGFLVMVGFGTTWAAFVCSGEMAAAYFMAQLPFAVLPINPRPGILAESAVFNAFFFLYVASRGAGPLSVDYVLGWWRAKPRHRASVRA
jgi:putative oxidoreductase